VLRTDQSSVFTEKWTELLSSADDATLQDVSYKITVPRSSIARFTLEVIEEVSGLHERGKIHADIKPSNILISRNDRLLIDDADLNIGDVSPTVTPGWSPSEQLLRQPLSPAADIFSLGQLLLHVLGAEPLGKEVRYRMPGGQMALLFDDPSVYISVDQLAPVETREDWCRLIERALKTDPGQRWPTVRSMADEMRDLLDREELRGEAEIKLPWGDRPVLVLDANGQPTAGWVIASGHENTLLWA
jgi:serine/threonine protein kinase